MIDLSQEHSFINLQSDNKDLKYARQNCVNRRFSSALFSRYNGYQIVGFTLNEKKTKVIRIFFNKYTRPEGDRVCETTHYPIKLKTLTMLHSNGMII
jgi:hypothetical protein